MTAGPLEILDQLEVALDAAVEVPIGYCRPEEISTWAKRLHAIRSKIDALACSAAVAVGGADLPAHEGQRTVPAYLAAHTGADPKAVAADVRMGSWLLDYSVIAEAFRAGEVTQRHVAALRRLDNPRTGAALADAQEYLVDAARTCSWREFNQVLRYWALAGDPDGAEPVDQQARRFCRYRKLADGSVAGSFELDPIAGQALVTAIDAESQIAFRQETDASLTTAAQRRADAFAAVVLRGCSRTTGGPPPTLIHIVMSEQVAEATLASLDDSSTAPASRPVLHPTDIDGRCELVDGTPLHPRLAMGAMATATLRRLIMRADSQPVDLGRAVRTFPNHLKQALLASARGRCQASGCDAPLAWLEADHVTPWNQTGRTALGNGQMLCGPHNKAKSDTLPTESPPPPQPAQPGVPPPQPSPREPGQSSPPGGRE